MGDCEEVVVPLVKIKPRNSGYGLITDPEHAFPYSPQRMQKLGDLGRLLKKKPRLGAKVIEQLLETRSAWESSRKSGIQVGLEVEDKLDALIIALHRNDHKTLAVI